MSFAESAGKTDLLVFSESCLTNHVWAGFGFLQVDSLCEEQKAEHRYLSLSTLALSTPCMLIFPPISLSFTHTVQGVQNY